MHRYIDISVNRFFVFLFFFSNSGITIQANLVFMKKIISTFSALLLVGMALFSGLFPTLVVAAPAERLEIEAPKTAKV